MAGAAVLLLLSAALDAQWLKYPTPGISRLPDGRANLSAPTPRTVVETVGFNDKGWLDNAGHPSTARLRVTERFRRKDFGHMDIDITIDDPGAYAKPWTVTLPLLYQADTELLESLRFLTQSSRDHKRSQKTEAHIVENKDA